MIINLLNKIPIRIYLYIIVFLIIASGLIAAYLYFNMGFDIVYKSVIIWYIVILELNLIHLFMVLKFYQSNLNKKGEKGERGKVGPRGFKGEDDMCRSCGLEGTTINKMAGTTSDTVVPINNEKIVSGKCLFPYIHNYDYQYDCFKGKLPDDIYDQLSEEDKRDANASVYGWCPTKLKDDKTPKTIGFCNESKNAAIKSKLREKRARDRIAYAQNNKGIVDIKLIDGVTKQEAAKNCPEGWTINPQDLNEGTGGRFIYLCYKKDTAGRGITDLRVAETECDTSDPTDCPPVEIDGYKVINNHDNEELHLNKDSKGAEQNTKKLYLYKKIENTGFLKDIQFTKSKDISNAKCLDGYENPGINDNYKAFAKNLNLHSNQDKDDLSGTGIPHIINLCVKRKGDNLLSIDTAFVYKDKNLYFFRGDKFFKMKKKPINNALLIESKYPKNISEKWFKQENGATKKAKMCSAFDKNEKSCLMHSNCIFDNIFSKCEPKSGYDAAFTYGYNNKTYFFKGDKIYLYDDTKMKLASGYPKKIGDVFKGVPDDISAVFTWNYDGKTYFFKDNQYYKYNDKSNKVERGYPRKSNSRWPGIPNLINAIFSLPNKINSSDPSSTYIISGSDSFVIDEKTSSVKNKKDVSERFSGLSITEKEKE